MPKDYYILHSVCAEKHRYKSVPVKPNHTYIAPAFYPLEGVYKVGDNYDGQPNLIITEVLYRPRRWWQFWKKKNQTWGYRVECKEMSHES